MDPPYFVWINTNEIFSSWYLLGAVCVPPPCPAIRFGKTMHGVDWREGDEVLLLELAVADHAGDSSLKHRTQHTILRE
jgi:hypothetical protein